MIVLAYSLLATPPADYEPWLPIIGWQNLVTAANIEADDEDPDFPAVRLANPNTNELWLSTILTTQYVTVTLESPEEIDYVAIARHNWGTAGITVSIEGYTTADGWVEIVEEFIPADDTPLICRFAAASYEAVRIKLQPDATEPLAGVVYVGALLVLEWGVQAGHTPLPYGRERNIVAGRSESGEYLGRIQSGGARKSRAEIRNLSADFYRESVDPFFAFGGPFFFAWDPQDHPTEVGYAWCVNDPVPVPELDGRISISLDMEAIA